MDDREAIEMMRRASAEIKLLRKQIDVLMPKADAYDMIGKILNLLPAASRGYGEDVAYMLDKRIKELEKVSES
jgi:hypothetical protein